MKKLLILLSFVFFITGCSTTANYNYKSGVKQISKPELNKEVKTYLGDVILSQGLVSNSEVLTFPNDVKISGLVSFYISAGSYVRLGDNKKYNYYNIKELDSKIPIQMTAHANYPYAISTFRGQQNNKICVNTSTGNVCNDNVIYKIEHKEIVSENSLLQNLIYNGLSGHKINIIYKEIKGNSANNTIIEDKDFDISKSKIINYKGASIEVIKATNQYIEYKVLSNFNIPY